MPSARDYRHEAILRDGGSIVLRALQGGDQPALADLYARLSPRSLRFRFLGSRAGVTAAELAELAHSDGVSQVALAAVAKRDGVERIAGIGHYAAPVAPGTPAEVAFAVADDQQGRGIGTLLLEHLARLAHGAGVELFEADVLAENRQMLDVFSDSGFKLAETMDAGVWHVVFPTGETDRFLAASLARERRAAAESVRVFFEPRSVAVVGASPRPGTIGNALIANLVRCGYAGPIHPIHPTAAEIEGRPCRKRVTEIPGGVDLAVVAVPAPAVEEVVADCARAGAHGVVVISAGFGEASPDGKAVERRLRDLARGAGMRMVGPNCMGVLNADPAVSLNATFAPGWPPAGNVSMASQSGALGLAMIDHAAGLNIGLKDFVSVGNKADVSGNDLLSFWENDDKTGVIALYLESFGNPRKFARLAPEIARKKPIVAVKSGRSAAGTRAASSHTSALASLDVGVDALFAQAGVVRTDTLEQLFDVVALLSSQPPPRGPRVGVVTNAGGPGILLADACEARGLSVPELGAATKERLRAFLPPHAGLANPVDMIASASAEQYRQAIELVGADPQIDAVVVIYIPPLVTKPEEVAAAIADAAGRLPPEKPIASVFMSSKGTPQVLSTGPRGNIPSYAFPENAALALSAAARWERWRRRPPGQAMKLAPDREQAVRAVVRRLRQAPPQGGWVPAPDLAILLEIAGVAFAPLRRTAPDPELAGGAAADLGAPVVLKASAPGLIHKSDVGAVALGLESPGAVTAAARAMTERLRAAGYAPDAFLVQREVRGGLEALVGVITDPSLGPLLVAGLGGVQVELLRDVSIRLTPVTDVDAAEMLANLRAAKLLDGYRGAPAADRAALTDVILRVSALVETLPELLELDLNPVKVLPPGQGAIVVDGRMRLAFS